MRVLRSLIWKEWTETRLFLWIAWGLFIGLPYIGTIEARSSYSHGLKFCAWPWVVLAGPMLAIVMGVAQTCRDLQAKLEDFWQSRPMGPIRLFTVKYLVDGLILLIGCGVPLLIDWIQTDDRYDVRVTLWLLLFCVAIYSIAFASGCIFQRTAHAAAAAVVAVLLLICLPIVIPPFQAFGAEHLYGLLGEWSGKSLPLDRQEVQFAGAMVVISVGMFALGVAAVRFKLHVESEQWLIYGAACAAFLIVVSSASYQLGTNLPILSDVHPLPHDAKDWVEAEQVRGIMMTGLSGIAETENWRGSIKSWVGFDRTIAIGGNTLQVGLPTQSPPSYFNELEFDEGEIPWWHMKIPGFPGMAYYLEGQVDERTKIEIFSLEISDNVMAEVNGHAIEAAGPALRAMPIELWRGAEKETARPYFHRRGNRLYVVGQRTIIFDISDPLKPKRISDEPVVWRIRSREDVFTIPLPPMHDVSTVERLNFAMQIAAGWYTTKLFDGSNWCRYFEDPEHKVGTFQLLHLAKLTDSEAKFELIAKHEPTMVERLFGGQLVTQLRVENGFAYATMNYGNIDVFTLTGDHPLRLVAHFAAPGSWWCTPLEDGRAIVGGTNRIVLLGPPPRGS